MMRAATEGPRTFPSEMVRCRARGIHHILLLLPLLLVAGVRISTAVSCKYQTGYNWHECTLTKPWEQPLPKIENAPKIEVFLLGMSVTPLTATLLTGLNSLKILNVYGHCHIYSNDDLCMNATGLGWIEAGAFKNMSALINLELTRHPLRNLSLDGLNRLKNLRLDDILNLRELPAAVLDPVRASIKRIFVENTQVEVLRRGLLCNMSRLTELKWHGRLRRIERGVVGHLPNIGTFKMKVTVTSCDCGVLELIRWANKSKQSSNLNIICQNYGGKLYPTRKLAKILENVSSPNCDSVSTTPATTTPAAPTPAAPTPKSSSTTSRADNIAGSARPDVFLLFLCLGIVLHMIFFSLH